MHALPVWDRLWIFRFSRREKHFPHKVQRWGFSLVWVRIWISILYLKVRNKTENEYLQNENMHLTQCFYAIWQTYSCSSKTCQNKCCKILKLPFHIKNFICKAWGIQDKWIDNQYCIQGYICPMYFLPSHTSKHFALY